METERLLNERAVLREQADRISQRLTLIDDALRALGHGSHAVGPWKVQVQTNRRLDTAALASQFPAESNPHLYKAALDTEAIKQHLAPAVLDAYYRDGAPRVVVK
ncbi:hypothetical protein [Agromyces larvae]|uniref:Uncharacterized protein n=1 Tax=Agromyces larvae TaxID=2929802 RepID=A0ABY4C361_9MICO|nr:hypothetical protein [Agromyces larvae]UOE45912.1 hypothetical protein MTO99_09285 [Agromyces larvae]